MRRKFTTNLSMLALLLGQLFSAINPGGARAAGAAPLGSAPTVLALAINHFDLNGSAFCYTNDRKIVLYNRVSDKAAFYAASESPHFRHAPWERYSDHPKFTLSKGNGTKQLYFKVRDAAGRESAPVKSALIWLEERAELELGKSRSGEIRPYDPVANPDDNADLYSFTVKKAGEYVLDVTRDRSHPLHDFTRYVCGPDGVREVYPTYYNNESGSMGMILNPGKYYLILLANSLDNGDDPEDSTPGWDAGKYSIRIWRHEERPLVTNFDIPPKITIIGEPTFTRDVTLTNRATGAPKFMMASESPDFKGAAWQGYATSSPFTLSPEPGSKIVYFKVKDGRGRESNVQSRVIAYVNPTPLTVDGPTGTGVYGPNNTAYFGFTASQAGTYTVQLQGNYYCFPANLYNVAGGGLIDGTQSYKNDNSRYTVRYTYTLAPGTYVIEVGTAIPNTGGAPYTIRVLTGN